jgi:hypothetical protein
MPRNAAGKPEKLHEVRPGEVPPPAEAASFESPGLLGTTLTDTRFLPIFEVQGDNTTGYGAGHGVSNKNNNNQGWSDLDLQNTVPGAIDAALRWEVYRDSSQEQLAAHSGKFYTTPLRNAIGNATREKFLMAARGSPNGIAGDQQYLVLAARADPASSGDTVDPGQSNTEEGIAYSEYDI